MANASEPPWSWSPSKELISSLATAPLLYHSGYLDCVCNLIYLHVLNVSKLQKPKSVNVETSTFFFQKEFMGNEIILNYCNINFSFSSRFKANSISAHFVWLPSQHSTPCLLFLGWAQHAEAKASKEILVMSCNCFCPKKQKPNLSSIPWISCIYFLVTCVGSHLGRTQAPSGVLAFWAHVRHFPSPHDCLMSISHFSSPHGCLLLITFHLHMVASYQSLPISTWLPHVHHFFSPHGCLTSVTSPLQIAASYSSRLIST